MTEEKLLKLVIERGWHQFLRAAQNTQSLYDLSLKLGKSRNHMLLELKAIRALGLVELVNKDGGGYRCIPTALGIKFLQE